MTGPLPVSWKTSLSDTRYRNSLLLSFLFLAIVLTVLTLILAYAEARKGIVIEKGWLGFQPPVDLSSKIFFATYGFSLLGLVLCFRNPQLALRLVQAYALLSAFRCITLLLVPLDPPEGIIPLDDPLLRNSFYAGRPNLKDLFFSGHTATLLLFAFLLEGKWWKGLFTLVALAVGVMVMLQRVHYVSDVIAAPVFAFVVMYLTRRPVMLPVRTPPRRK